MPRRLHLQEQFDSYRREVIPADAPLVQVTECRRAFFAGAQAMRAVLENAPDDPKAQMSFCDEIEQELRDFVRRELAQGIGSKGRTS